jgi:hypothetical protein
MTAEIILAQKPARAAPLQILLPAIHLDLKLHASRLESGYGLFLRPQSIWMTLPQTEHTMRCVTLGGAVSELLAVQILFMQATEWCAVIAMHDLQTMQSSRKTKMDEFEYVTYGKIFKYADAGVDTNTNAVRTSFRMQTLYKLHALNCVSLLRGMLLLLH